MAEMNPTPAPAMRRPTTITAKVVEAVSRMQPTENVRHPEIMVQRRPMWSARSYLLRHYGVLGLFIHPCEKNVQKAQIRNILTPAMMAPKNVPQERIPVMRDCCHPGRTNAATAAVLLGSGYFVLLDCCFQNRMNGELTSRPVYKWMKYFIPIMPPIHPVS